MGQAQINVRTRACSGTFIARTKQAALTHNVRGKELSHWCSLRICGAVSVKYTQMNSASADLFVAFFINFR